MNGKENGDQRKKGKGKKNAVCKWVQKVKRHSGNPLAFLCDILHNAMMQHNHRMDLLVTRKNMLSRCCFLISTTNNPIIHPCIVAW